MGSGILGGIVRDAARRVRRGRGRGRPPSAHAGRARRAARRVPARERLRQPVRGARLRRAAVATGSRAGAAHPAPLQRCAPGSAEPARREGGSSLVGTRDSELPDELGNPMRRDTAPSGAPFAAESGATLQCGGIVPDSTVNPQLGACAGPETMCSLARHGGCQRDQGSGGRPPAVARRRGRIGDHAGAAAAHRPHPLRDRPRHSRAGAVAHRGGAAHAARRHHRSPGRERRGGPPARGRAPARAGPRRSRAARGRARPHPPRHPRLRPARQDHPAEPRLRAHLGGERHRRHGAGLGPVPRLPPRRQPLRRGRLVDGPEPLHRRDHRRRGGALPALRRHPRRAPRQRRPHLRARRRHHRRHLHLRRHHPLQAARARSAGARGVALHHPAQHRRRGGRHRRSRPHRVHERGGRAGDRVDHRRGQGPSRGRGGPRRRREDGRPPRRPGGARAAHRRARRGASRQAGAPRARRLHAPLLPSDQSAAAPAGRAGAHLRRPVRGADPQRGGRAAGRRPGLPRRHREAPRRGAALLPRRGEPPPRLAHPRLRGHARQRRQPRPPRPRGLVLRRPRRARRLAHPRRRGPRRQGPRAAGRAPLGTT